GRHVEPLIALQANEAPPERRAEHLRDLGLADAGLAFEKQRPAHLEREKQHGRKRAVGEVVGRRKQVERGVDGRGERMWRRRRHATTAAATARRASTPTRWARYSALPWMSLPMPSAGIVMPSSDFGPKRFFSASSNAVTRNTPLAPAPVTATRISEPRLDTNTPTSA